MTGTQGTPIQTQPKDKPAPLDQPIEAPPPPEDPRESAPRDLEPKLPVKDEFIAPGG
ncbi:hypothetical protein [Xanthobacter autotrophicus]|uniref:hypothetical protein n=1 Tax=Xanthobacter autotrophicus TaxID=280 RepID=UPI0037280DA6